MKAACLFLLVLAVGCQQPAATESTACNCGALLIPNHVQVPVYDRPNGNVAAQVMNDTLEEDYVVMSIEQYKDQWLKVSAAQAISRKEAEGWLPAHWAGIYSAIYTGPLSLYSQPDSGAAVKQVVKEWYNDLWPIVSCQGQWLYVRLKKDGQVSEGWLAPDDQCDNPYTTCN